MTSKCTGWSAMLAIAAISAAIPGAIGGAISGALANDAPASQITSVVELFTSQGCSSCPPADALLPSYIQREGILALSFSVDYWDSLGWKDTLASPKNSQRQRDYARSRGDGQVYTPQTVINGMTHAVGSDQREIDNEIRRTEARTKELRVQLGVTATSNGVQVGVPMWSAAHTAAVEATLWLVKLTPRVEVAIKRGENTGRTIAYHNVVREMTRVGSWSGEASTIDVPQAALAGCVANGCAVLLQQGGTGSILGAAWVPAAHGT